MNWLDDVLARLAAAEAWGYHAESPSATEPAALTAIALLAHGRVEAAQKPLAWVSGLQGAGGIVGVDAAQSTPEWPTSLAVLAWHFADETAGSRSTHARAIERGVNWILQTEGSHFDHVDQLGHDSSLRGWPWVEGTHSWTEPTAMHVLALKHTGHDDHLRVRDGVRLLEDRLLDTGGCNYGNTLVFGQKLRPHVQPTGLALLALAGEGDPRGHVAASVAYLEDELSTVAAPHSLCYGLLGLAGQDRWPGLADGWLAAAARRTLSRRPAPYTLALLALAAQGKSCPLIFHARAGLNA